MARIYRSSEETRQLILKHADRAIHHYGYHKTTIADIARDCGMSPANIYRFFDSKEAIAGALLKEWREDVHTGMVRICEGGGSVEEKLRACLREVYERTNKLYVHENKVHQLIIVALEEQWESIALYLYMVREVLQNLLEAGVAAGEFKLPDDAKRIAHTLMHACSVYIHPYMLAQYAHQGLSDRLGTLLDVLLNGLKAEK